jgi:hypothetical protein
MPKLAQIGLLQRAAKLRGRETGADDRAMERGTELPELRAARRFGLAAEHRLRPVRRTADAARLELGEERPQGIESGAYAHIARTPIEIFW